MLVHVDPKKNRKYYVTRYLNNHNITGMKHEPNNNGVIYGEYMASWPRSGSGNIFEGVWDDNQPDFTAGHCVSIKRNIAGHVVWSSEACDRKLPFVCERAACPQGVLKCYLKCFKNT